MLIGSERKPVILVAQLHKEAVYERKDERIKRKKKVLARNLVVPISRPGTVSESHLIYITDKLPGPWSVLHNYRDCCV